jgi:hypothetical protein
MNQYDESSGIEQWDDTVVSDSDLVTGEELPLQQEIPRQSMRMTYTEPHAKPNTVAGLLAMALGTVTSTQDGALAAYRHKMVLSSSLGLPSIGVQVLRENGTQWMYTGVKASSIEFMAEQAQPYMRMQAVMIGSGTRTTSVTAFAPAVTEAWLRLGDAKVYIKDTAGTPITIPATPSQTAPNLGGSEVNLSSRILSWGLRWDNNIPADYFYRAGAGVSRSSLNATRRTGLVPFLYEVDSATELTDLTYYTAQKQLAMEFNLNSGTIIAATGVFKYGVIILIPRMQIRPFTRGQQNQIENFNFEGQVMSDSLNPAVVAYVYTTHSTFLA